MRPFSPSVNRGSDGSVGREHEIRLNPLHGCSSVRTAGGLASWTAGAAHPVVLGPQKINAFFDTALKVGREKLAEERKTAR